LRPVIQVDKQFSYSVGPESFTINYKPALHEGDSNSLRSIEIHNVDISVLRRILNEIGQTLPISGEPRIDSRRNGHPQEKQTAKGTVRKEPYHAE